VNTRLYNRRLGERMQRFHEDSLRIFQRIEADDPMWISDLDGPAAVTTSV
jgi:hypothetical protein